MTRQLRRPFRMAPHAFRFTWSDRRPPRCASSIHRRQAVHRQIVKPAITASSTKPTFMCRCTRWWTSSSRVARRNRHDPTHGSSEQRPPSCAPQRHDVREESDEISRHGQGEQCDGKMDQHRMDGFHESNYFSATGSSDRISNGPHAGFWGCADFRRAHPSVARPARRLQIRRGQRD